MPSCAIVAFSLPAHIQPLAAKVCIHAFMRVLMNCDQSSRRRFIRAQTGELARPAAGRGADENDLSENMLWMHCDDAAMALRR